MVIIKSGHEGKSNVSMSEAVRLYNGKMNAGRKVYLDIKPTGFSNLQNGQLAI